MQQDNVKKRRQQNFLQGSAILMAGTILVKIIGMIFKIPLANFIGGRGGGYYITAYDLYTPIYTLAMAGLPIAISRMVAEFAAKKRFLDVKKTLQISQRVFLVTGALGTVGLFIAVRPFLDYIGNPNAYLSTMAVVPALLFCCFMSSYRGFYEGLCNMYPTTISSVIESLGKLILGLGGAFAISEYAKHTYFSTGLIFGKALEFPTGFINTPENLNKLIIETAAPYSAGIALLGITLGSVIATVYLIIYHKVSGAKITKQEFNDSPLAYSAKETFSSMLKICIPVVLGSLVLSAAGTVDVMTVQTTLGSSISKTPDFFRTAFKGLMPEVVGDGSNTTTLIAEMPNYLYSCYKLFAYSIFNLLPSLTTVFGVSALPVLATAWTNKDKKGIKENIDSTVRFTALLALPGGVGIATMAGPILQLLYSDVPKVVTIATPLLTVLGVAVVFTAITTPITNMLQAIGKQNIPVRNLAIGVGLKLIINLTLVRIPEINIMGAAIGTLVLYLFHFTASLIALIKHSGVKLDFVTTLIKPLIAALCCGGTAVLMYKLTSEFISKTAICTILSIAVGGAVYLTVLLLTKTVSKDDLKMLKANKNTSN